MSVTPGRRSLAAASVPDVSQYLCQQTAYLTDDATADAIFDQLGPDEYLSVAQYFVSAHCSTADGFDLKLSGWFSSSMRLLDFQCSACPS